MKTNAIIAIIVGVAVVGIAAASPLFINTTIDEALPEGAVIKESMMEEKAMMEEEMMQIESMWYSGAFVGVGDGIHDVEGSSIVIPLEDGSQILRLENFESTNGPDLFVYLSTDDTASDYVDLGLLKANRGNQNYEIPDGTDLSKYNNVLIWCKSFSVLFGSSELTPQS